MLLYIPCILMLFVKISIFFSLSQTAVRLGGAPGVQPGAGAVVRRRLPRKRRRHRRHRRQRRKFPDLLAGRARLLLPPPPLQVQRGFHRPMEQERRGVDGRRRGGQRGHRHTRAQEQVQDLQEAALLQVPRAGMKRFGANEEHISN